MAVNPNPSPTLWSRRPGWMSPLLLIIQFAAIVTILFYVAPFNATKSGAEGVIVFLVAMVVAFICSWSV